MIKSTLALCTILSLSLSAFAQSPSHGTVEFQDAREDGRAYVVIRMKGEIIPPMADEFYALVAKLPEKVPLWVHLNSEGGSVQEGLKIIGAMRLIKRERTLTTLVRNGEMCASMCVPLFLQGTRRLAAAVSTFMFHGSSASMLTNIPDEKKTNELLNLYIDAGVSKDWIDSMKKKEAFSAPGEYWLSGQELMDQKSNVLTEVISRHVRVEPWTAPVDTNIRPR